MVKLTFCFASLKREEKKGKKLRNREGFYLGGQQGEVKV